MACPVCAHAQVAEIDANSAHLSLRQLERQYHVSRSSLGRHVQRCQLPATQAPDAPGTTGAPVPPPVPAGNPLEPYHAEALQVQAACRTARYTDNWVHLAGSLANLLVKMTTPH